MGGVYSDNCKNLNTTNMLQELITLLSRSNRPDERCQCIEHIKNIKEHFPYFELGVEEDVMYKPLSIKQ